MNMNTTNHLIPLTDAIVARGQVAWGLIKKTAAEQRELWRQVGEALLVGRRMHKADQKFSQWCKEMGFTFSEKSKTNANMRSAAMWLARSEVPTGWEPTITSPWHLQAAWNEHETTSTLPADLQEASIETKTVPTVDQKTAEKVAKLAQQWASIVQRLDATRAATI